MGTFVVGESGERTGVCGGGGENVASRGETVSGNFTCKDGRRKKIPDVSVESRFFAGADGDCCCERPASDADTRPVICSIEARVAYGLRARV